MRWTIHTGKEKDMKYRFHPDNNFERQLMHRMREDCEDTRKRVIEEAVSHFRYELERIVAQYSIDISTFLDDYDMTRRVKLEMIIPKEDKDVHNDTT